MERIDPPVAGLHLSHNPIERFFQQAAVEGACMHHSAALLLKDMGDLTARFDLLKACLQIEFEQSLDRALAA